MSPTNSDLPAGFDSVDKAVELIKSDTRQNPVVDMDWLIRHIVWLDRNGMMNTFRIPKIRRLEAGEVYKNRRGVLVEYEHTGEMNVFIRDSFDRELLKKTIQEKYRELVGHEYVVQNTRAMSTVADDAAGRNAVMPRRNAKSIAKEGAAIGDGGISDTNGQGITV